MGIRLWQAVSPAKTKLSLPAKYAEPSLAQSDLLCVFLPVVFYRGCKKRSPGSPVAAFSIQLYPKNRSQPSLKKTIAIRLLHLPFPGPYCASGTKTWVPIPPNQGAGLPQKKRRLHARCGAMRIMPTASPRSRPSRSSRLWLGTC